MSEPYDTEYDIVYGEPADGFLLNGHTYPDTVHESLVVRQGGMYRLNMANTATETVTVGTDSEELELSVRNYREQDERPTEGGIGCCDSA